jgi:hypothetical protein
VHATSPPVDSVIGKANETTGGSIRTNIFPLDDCASLTGGPGHGTSTEGDDQLALTKGAACRFELTAIRKGRYGTIPACSNARELNDVARCAH